MPRTRLQMPNFTLNKRRDGYYVIRYEQDGETKTRATGTKDPTEAEAERARFVAEYKKPKVGPRPTVTEISEAYLAARQPFVADHKRMAHSFIAVKRHLGSLYADSITQSVVDGYITTRRVEKPERKKCRWGDEPVKDATISKELRMLRAAITWARKEGIIESQREYSVNISSGEARVEWISKVEAKKLEEVAAPHLALFIRLALATAKRREAILSLRWDKVDLTPGREKIDFGDDVGNKRRGEVYINGHTKLLNALTEARRKAQTPFVIEYKGKGLKDVKTAMAAACKRAGIREISAHVLKHSSITWMLNDHMTFEQIAMKTHTSKEIIQRVYGHLSPQFVAAAASATDF